MDLGAPYRMAEAARRVAGWLRGVVPALIVALPPLAWVREATYRATLTTLGRDQGIFQYVAWALMHGDVDYRDVRDVNGPLTHMIHMGMLLLGGRDEHRFHVIDLTVTGISFAIVGACLPGLGRKGTRWASAAEEWLTRLAWAGATWVVLSGQLLMYLYWDLAQRETFCDWFMLPSFGLQLLAQARLAERGRGTRGPAALLVLAGVLSAIPCFGKPTFAFFTMAQLLTLAVDRGGPMRTRRKLTLFLGGCLLGASTQLAFLWRYGDIRAFLRITLFDVPTMYRFMMPRTASEILSLQWGGTAAALSAVTSAVMVALILDGQLPRRALGIALMPLCGLASVLAQSKGFPYHFHPVTAGLNLQWVALVVWLSERFGRARTGIVTRLLPYAGAAVLAGRIAALMPLSPHINDVWILSKGATAEQRVGHDYLVYFRGSDYFPWEMRQTAAYLREHTRPSDKVQMYGMDPYMLFLAERKSATPYIYAYDLNADGALAGSWMRAGIHPTKAQAAHIRALRAAHEKDMLARLKKSPPAAFVFMDKAPLTTWADSIYDFKVHDPDTSAWVKAHYRETASFGEDHVFLRDDLAADVSRADP